LFELVLSNDANFIEIYQSIEWKIKNVLIRQKRAEFVIKM